MKDLHPDHPPVNNYQGLESLRSSNFDTYSAYAEIIDNSIQAEATNVQIFLEPQAAKPNKIDRAHFCDDGVGMDNEILRVCLGLGDSSRINDRKGIGRFGVGMTLGALHECTKIEVYSKTKSGNWMYTYLDLDRIKAGQGIPFPTNKSPEPPSAISLPDTSGTYIIWSNYDTPHEKLPDLIIEAKFLFGRMFRRFITGTSSYYNQICLTINGEIIKAIDPLYYNKTCTGFEGEPTSELLQPSSHKAVYTNDTGEQKESEITINMSLLPEAYTKRYKGSNEFAKARGINRNEGISIMRNDREVFFGHIPYARLENGRREVQRYVGIEINFNAEIDQLFQVRNIKRGAIPIPELREKLISILRSPLKDQLKKLDLRWDAQTKAKQEKTKKESVRTGVSADHVETQVLIKKTKDKLLQTQKEKANPDITPELVNEKATKEQKEAIKALLNTNGITVNSKPLSNTDFIDIYHGSEGKLLTYNTRTPFHEKYDSILKIIGTKEPGAEADARVLIDVIFCAYLLAEGTLDFSLERRQDLTLNDLKTQWGIQLLEILSKWD